jgi:hypothetical protein
MTILLCGLAVVMVGASVVTTYAALNAKDGYEDESGFHILGTREQVANQAEKKEAGDNLPPFAPAS